MNITAVEFFEKVIAERDNPSVVIIDIRTLDEYEVYHLVGAINIDFYKDNFADMLDALDKSKTYMIYCRTGRRTGTDDQNARDLMKRMGFSDVYNMLGGIHEFVKVTGADDFID
jgi:rhodanese-related sulfurtransferase